MVSPSIGSAVARASSRIVVRSRLRIAVSAKISCALFGPVFGLVAVMIGPFEENVELGTAHTGQTVGRAQDRAGGAVADDDNPGLVAGDKLKAMSDKAGAEVVSISAIGPGGA